VRRSLVPHFLAVAVALCVPHIVDASSDPAPTGGAAVVHPDASRLQTLVDHLRDGLAITAPVQVSVVAEDARAFSVRIPGGQAERFDLSIDAAFLAQLSEDELAAAIAHELGHVWVFTHHPYLQTERLANDIAMRVVPRASLERVYEKVWARDGVKGEIARFLGPATPLAD
jgi:hypothetical protein